MISQFSGILYMNQIKRNNNSANSRDMFTATWQSDRHQQHDPKSCEPSETSCVTGYTRSVLQGKKDMAFTSMDDRHRNKQYSSKTWYSNPLQSTKNQQRATQKVINRHSKQGKYINIHSLIPAKWKSTRDMFILWNSNPAQQHGYK